MADFWIKIEKGTPDKPEILELAALLDIEDPDTITGKMIRVWSWFDSNSENGHAPLVTKVLLDRMTGVTGLTEALVSVGWLDKTEIGFCLPNFERHLGKGAKKRASDAERKRKSRDNKQQCHSKSVTKIVTEEGPEKSRVEKSREDNKKTLKNTSPTAPDPVFAIFDHWREVMNKGPSTKPTKGRIDKIKARLKTFSAEQIKLAITGCASSDHHMARNPKSNPENRLYDDLTLICRNDEKIEQFIGYTENISVTDQRNADLEDWFREGQQQEIETGETFDHEPGR